MDTDGYVAALMLLGFTEEQSSYEPYYRGMLHVDLDIRAHIPSVGGWDMYHLHFNGGVHHRSTHEVYPEAALLQLKEYIWTQ